MHCGFKCHLLTIRWQVASHWPTDISTMRLCVALYLQQMTRLHGLHMLCNASVHRSSLLLVYRWHTMTIIAPPGYLTFCSFICLSLHCDDHVMYWYVKTLSIFVSLGAELRYIVNWYYHCSSIDYLPDWKIYVDTGDWNKLWMSHPAKMLPYLTSVWNNQMTSMTLDILFR